MPITTINVMHYVKVRAAVANVNGMVRANIEFLFEFLKHSDLAAARRHAFDSADFLGVWIVFEFRATYLTLDRVGEVGAEVGRESAVVDCSTRIASREKHTWFKFRGH